MCFTKFCYWWAKTKNLLQEKIATQPISPMTINCNHSCCAALHCCFRYFQIFSNIFAWYVHSHILQYINSDNIWWNTVVGTQRLPLPMKILQCNALRRGGTEMLSIKLHFIFILGWWSCDGWLMNVGVNTCWWLNMASISLCWPIIHVFDPNHAKTWGQHAAVTPTRLQPGDKHSVWPTL